MCFFSLRLDVDDQYSNFTSLDSTETEDVNVTLYFGSIPNWITLNAISSPFTGCLGDVTVGGKFLDFAQATSYTTEVGAVSLVGCNMEAVVPTLSPATEGGVDPGARSIVEALEDKETGKWL